MDPKHKGALAELLASAWLLKQGYEVFRNVSQCGVADMVAWRPGGLPVLVEVRTATLRAAADGKSCSVMTARLPRHTDVKFLYVFPATGDCGFDLEALVQERGYQLRPPPQITLLCSVAGCGRKHSARGFCKMHYDRWSRGLADGLSLVPQPKAV